MSVLGWLQDTYVFNPDLLFLRSSTTHAWSDNFSGANYTGDAGNVANNASSSAVVESAQDMTSAANVGLATGVLLAVLLNSHYDTIKREWRSEYQLWTEALIIRIVFSIVCLLLAFVAAPFALVMFVCFACYRKAAHMILNILHGSKFVGLMDGVDTVWALEEDASRSVVNVLGMLEVDDAPDDDTLLMTLRQTIVSRFFTAAHCCQKLLHLRRRSVLGYFYWERQKGLQIDSHVRWMPDGLRLEDDGGVSEDTLGEIVSKLANMKLPADHASSWEILVSRRPMTELSGDPFQSLEEGFPVRSGTHHRYPVLFRVHHAVGDGVALLHLMMKALIKDSCVKQSDGNLPDICITTGDKSSTEENNWLITENIKNQSGKQETMKSKGIVQEGNINKISPSEIQIEAASERNFTGQHQQNRYKFSSITCPRGSTSGSNNFKSKSSPAQPLEFQSDINYSNNSIRVPCYVTDKKVRNSNTVENSVSIRKSNPNMVVYFQKSLPVVDTYNYDVENNHNIPLNITKTIKNSYNVRNNTCTDSEYDCSAIGIDMSDLETDTFLETEKPVCLRKGHKNSSNGQLSEVSIMSGNSDEAISCYCSSRKGHISSTEKPNKKPRKPRCKSPRFSNDLHSQNVLLCKRTPDCPTAEKYINNDDNMDCNEDFRFYTSELGTRPDSPISRPLTPTPYSLYQETRAMSQFSPSSITNISDSLSNLQYSCDDRPFSPTNYYYNCETRPVSPYNLLSDSRERSESPSCLQSTLDTPTSPNSFPVSKQERFLQSESLSSIERYSSLKTKLQSPLKRSLPSTHLKGKNINTSAKHFSKYFQSESLLCHSPLLKSHYYNPEVINDNTSDNSQFTIVPLNSHDKCTSHKNKDYLKTIGRYKVTDFLKKVFSNPTRKNMLVKRKGATKLNCYVKLLSTINGGNVSRVQIISRIWHVLSALIYAPASLIHQVLMKASDKNSLHGPTLSGKKVIAWYSDSSTPSICREYRLLNTIKRIKSRVPCEVRFTDVFLTAVSSSLEMYFKSKGTELPSSVSVVVPLRMEPMPEELSRQSEEYRTIKEIKPSFIPAIIEASAQKKANKPGNNIGEVVDAGLTFIEFPMGIEALQPSNQFSVALMTLPITKSSTPTCEEPWKPYTLTERIREVCLQSELVRNSLDYRVNYWLMRVVANLLPVPLLRPILNSAQSTLVVSNLKGPSQDIYLGDYKLGDLVFWVPNRGTTGVGISLMGYAGRLQVGLIADSALVPTRRDAQEVLHNVVSELRQMDAALSV